MKEEMTFVLTRREEKGKEEKRREVKKRAKKRRAKKESKLGINKKVRTRDEN